MRLEQLTAINGRRYRGNLLDRRNGYPLAERRRRQFDRSDLSSLNIMPFSSPFRSMPVFLPKPKILIYSNSLSLPNRCPSVTKPGLQEFSTTSRNVWLPCPPLFQQRSLAPAPRYSPDHRNALSRLTLLSFRPRQA